MAQQHGDPATIANNDSSSQMMPDVSMQQSTMFPRPHVQAMQGNSAPRNYFSGHRMPFNAPSIGAPNGNQMFCGQNLGFPVNKDVTRTNPLLVNLLQSDISTGNFGYTISKITSMQINRRRNLLGRRKIANPSTPDTHPAGLEEADKQPLPGKQGISLENSGPKQPEFSS